MSSVAILDKHFKLFITNEKINEEVQLMADRMNSELSKYDVIFIGILNGAFMFASDLLKRINFKCRISFLKLVSYEDISSTGMVKKLIGLNEDISGKTVIVIEDIIDTGITIENIVNQLSGYQPAGIRIASLLFKSGSYRKRIKIDYIGFDVPDSFIIGYGLDYNGYGRNLTDIYTLID